MRSQPGKGVRRGARQEGVCGPRVRKSWSRCGQRCRHRTHAPGAGAPSIPCCVPLRQKCPATTAPLPTQGASQDCRVPCPRVAFQPASMHADPWNSWTTEKPRMYPNSTPHPISGPGHQILNHIPHPENGLLFNQETLSHSDFSSG